MSGPQQPPARRLAFGDFELDLDARILRCRGVVVALRPKLLDLLTYLLANRERVVSKRDLRDHVWPDVAVSDEALTSALRDLRRALGDSEAPHRIVVTVRARGYRFAAALRSPDPLAAEAERGHGLLDREDAMQRLRDALAASAHGRPRVSLLAGPPGIGKTSVGMELVRHAHAADVQIHLARCYSGDGATAFWPWLQVVRSCLASHEARQVARELGVLGRLGWIAVELGAEAAETRFEFGGLEARFQLFDAIGVLLKALSRQRPLLIVIDDLHWADDASLLLLEFLSETLVDARLHLVAGLRDGEVALHPALARVLGALASHPGTDRIDLGGLRRDSVAQLLRAAARKEPSSAFIDKVSEATGGNPFFVTAVVDLVRAGQVDVGVAHDVPFPGRVRDALRLELERRSPPCQAVLKLASLVGRDFELVVLARAVGFAEMKTLEALDEAEAAGLVVTAAESGRHAFSHDLVREAIYRGLGASERTRLHRRMAAALEALSPAERLPEIAHHYSAAAPDGVADKALVYTRRAAERASGLMAYEDAVAYHDRALAVLPLVDAVPADLRCRILLDQAEAAWNTMEQAPLVQARFEQAASLARDLGSTELFVRAALGRTGHRAGNEDYRDVGRIDPVDIRLLREASELLGDQPSISNARVLARLSLAVRYAEPPAVSEQLSEQAVAMARKLGDPATLAAALRYRHEVISDPARARERIEIAQHMLELTRSSGHRSLTIDALVFLARDHFVLAEVAAARDAVDAATQLASTLRHPGAQFRAWYTKVLRLAMAGRFDDALAVARAQFECEAIRDMSAEGTFAAQRLMIHWLRGEHEEATQLLEIEAQNGHVYHCTRYSLGLEYAHVGRLADARAELDRAALDSFRNVPRDHTLLCSFMFLADLCFELRDVERARTLYELAVPFEGMIVAPFAATVCYGAMSRALGVLAHLCGDRHRAEHHFERALATERPVSPPFVALTLARYGRMLLDHARGSDRDRARVLLGEAASIANALGMRCVVPHDRDPQEIPKLGDAAEW